MLPEAVCEESCVKPDMSGHQTKIMQAIETRSETFTKAESLTSFSLKESRTDSTPLASFVDKRNLHDEGRDLSVSPCDYAPMDPACFTWVDADGENIYQETVEDLCVA